MMGTCGFNPFSYGICSGTIIHFNPNLDDGWRERRGNKCANAKCGTCDANSDNACFEYKTPRFEVNPNTPANMGNINPARKPKTDLNCFDCKFISNPLSRTKCNECKQNNYNNYKEKGKWD